MGSWKRHALGGGIALFVPIVIPLVDSSGDWERFTERGNDWRILVDWLLGRHEHAKRLSEREIRKKNVYACFESGDRAG